MRGHVLSNEDPLNKGRIKVIIPGIMDSKDVGNLPWIEYKSPFVGGTDAGTLIIPEVGTWVIVEEESSGVFIYSGTWNTSTDKPLEVTNFNQKVLFKSRTGHTIFLDDSPEGEKLRIIDRAGQIIEMNSPIKKDVSSRGIGNVIDGNAKTTSDVPTGKEASITVKDLSGNFLKLEANDQGGKVSLEGSDGANVTIDVENEKSYYRRKKWTENRNRC